MKLSKMIQFSCLSSFLSCICIYSGSLLATETLIIGSAETSLMRDIPTIPNYKIVVDAAKLLDIKIIFKTLPAKRSLQLVAEGELDAEISRHAIIEDKFPNLIRVNEPTGYSDYWVWVPENMNCPHSLKALNQLKPVGMRGIAFYDKFIYPKSEVGYEVVKAPKQLFGMLKKGRADYTVQSKEFMSQSSFSEGEPVKYCFDTPLFTLNFYLYLHPSKEYLKESFEMALRKIKYGY